MSEVTKEDVKTDETDTTTQEIDVKLLMERMEKLEATNSRLLEESKANKSKYQGLKSEVEAKEKEQLTDNEQWKELLEIEKNKRSEFETQLKETKKTVLQKELNFKVASSAKDAHDVTDIINALPRDLISIDDENLSINGVDEAVNKVRELKPWLFDTDKKSGQASGRPVVDNTTEDLRTEEEKLADALLGFVN